MEMKGAVRENKGVCLLCYAKNIDLGLAPFSDILASGETLSNTFNLIRF